MLYRILLLLLLIPLELVLMGRNVPYRWDIFRIRTEQDERPTRTETPCKLLGLWVGRPEKFGKARPMDNERQVGERFVGENWELTEGGKLRRENVLSKRKAVLVVRTVILI